MDAAKVSRSADTGTGIQGRKLKLLALHSFRTSARIFKEQARGSDAWSPHMNNPGCMNI